MAAATNGFDFTMHVPQEVSLLVFSALENAEDLGRCRRVNREWARLTNDPVLWNRFLYNSTECAPTHLPTLLSRCVILSTEEEMSIHHQKWLYRIALHGAGKIRYIFRQRSGTFIIQTWEVAAGIYPPEDQVIRRDYYVRDMIPLYRIRNSNPQSYKEITRIEHHVRQLLFLTPLTLRGLHNHPPALRAMTDLHIRHLEREWQEEAGCVNTCVTGALLTAGISMMVYAYTTTFK